MSAPIAQHLGAQPMSVQAMGLRPLNGAASASTSAGLEKARIVVTGGAGFVGSNLADRLLRDGHRVVVFDNLSRHGVVRNAQWLTDAHGASVEVVVGDVRDRAVVDAVMQGADAVFHLAAQVAVTTSVADPREDFSVNLQGTLNVLEAARTQPEPPVIVFTSTNKVYGDLDQVALKRQGQRYLPESPLIRAQGISEAQPLSFHSPYGCSKGAADQYVLDYARSYGLKTVVLRMSCIYGPRQFGTEDQGWVAHFLIRALQGVPITIYGDGMQVRDILFIDDLLSCFQAVLRRAEELSGCAFNVGGGPDNALSLLDLIDSMASLLGRRPEVTFGPSRVGDQRYYVTDTSALRHALGWSPTVPVGEGVARLHEWLRAAGRVADGAGGLRRPPPAPLSSLHQTASSGAAS